MIEPDHFKALGLARDATDEEVKKRYKELARQYHPDRNPGDKEAEERFKEISNAYEELNNSDAREKYLKKLRAKEQWQKEGEEQEQRRRARAPTGEAASAFGEAMRGASTAGSRQSGTFVNFPPPKPKSYPSPASVPSSNTTPPSPPARFDPNSLPARFGWFALALFFTFCSLPIGHALSKSVGPPASRPVGGHPSLGKGLLQIVIPIASVLGAFGGAVCAIGTFIWLIAGVISYARYGSV